MQDGFCVTAKMLKRIVCRLHHPAFPVSMPLPVSSDRAGEKPLRHLGAKTHFQHLTLQKWHPHQPHQWLMQPGSSPTKTTVIQKHGKVSVIVLDVC